MFNFGEEEAPLEEDPETSSDDDVMLAEWFQAKAREGAAARSTDESHGMSSSHDEEPSLQQRQWTATRVRHAVRSLGLGMSLEFVELIRILLKCFIPFLFLSSAAGNPEPPRPMDADAMIGEGTKPEQTVSSVILNLSPTSSGTAPSQTKIDIATPSSTTGAVPTIQPLRVPMKLGLKRAKL